MSAKAAKPPSTYLTVGARVDFSPRIEGEIVHIEGHRNGAFTLTIRADNGDHFFRSPTEVRLVPPRAKRGRKSK